MSEETNVTILNSNDVTFDALNFFVTFDPNEVVISYTSDSSLSGLSDFGRSGIFVPVSDAAGIAAGSPHVSISGSIFLERFSSVESVDEEGNVTYRIEEKFTQNAIQASTYHSLAVYSSSEIAVENQRLFFDHRDTSSGSIERIERPVSTVVSSGENTVLSAMEIRTFQASNVVIIGASSDDEIYGTDGSDSLVGGAGDDTLTPGQFYASNDSAADTMEGGEGSDIFVFDAEDAQDATDTINDFSIDDVIDTWGVFPDEGVITEKDPGALQDNEITRTSTSTQTILYFGIDDNIGFDSQLILKGDFRDQSFVFDDNASGAFLGGIRIGGIFTSEDDSINFNSLSPEEVELAFPAAANSDALKGNDIVVLPTSVSLYSEFFETSTYQGEQVYRFDAGEGLDDITGGVLRDLIVGDPNGQSFNDTISGGDGDDFLFGGGGDDNIYAGVLLQGDEGGNRLFGRDGDDYLYSAASDEGAAADTLQGDGGSDTFVVDINIDNYDQIVDLEYGESVIGVYSSDLSERYSIYSSDAYTWITFFQGDGGGAAARFQFNERLIPGELSVSYGSAGFAPGIQVDYQPNADAQFEQLKSQIAPIIESIACTVAKAALTFVEDAATSRAAKAAAPVLVDQILKSDAATDALVTALERFQSVFGEVTANQFENAIEDLLGKLIKPVTSLAIKKIDAGDCLAKFDNEALDWALLLTTPLQIVNPAVNFTAKVGPYIHISVIGAIDLYFASQEAELLNSLPDVMDGTIDGTTVIDGNEIRIIDDEEELPDDAGTDGTEDSVFSKASLESVPEKIENVYLEEVDGSPQDGLFVKANALDNTLAGNKQGNLMEGRAGNDWVLGLDGDDRLVGGAGLDTMFGGDDDDRLEGGSDDDSLDGGDDNDELFGGGSGEDTLIGGRGSDFLFGENGDDLLEGGDGFDLLNGGTDDDTLIGGNGNDRLLGNLGNDSLEGDAGNDSLFGGPSGNDILKGGDDDDMLFGETGRDILFGDDGNDTLNGGTNDDTLLGGNGDDSLEGGAGNDELFGGPTGADTLKGGQGSDFLFAESADDLLEGGDGFDLMNGGAGDDIMRGGNGGDRLEGNLGADTLEGGAGDDELFGGNGAFADTLDGGTGNDTLAGEAGADTFVFADGFGQDVITDFALAGGDVIDLSLVTAITDFTDLDNNHLSQNGANAVITDGANTITLNNVLVADLGADDFDFLLV